MTQPAANTMTRAQRRLHERMARRHKAATAPHLRQPAQPSNAIDSLISRFAGWAMVEMGSDETPIQQNHRQHMLDTMQAALDEMRTAAAPSNEAWRKLADLCNYLETMGALGYAPMAEVNHVTQPAIQALAHAAMRHQEQGLPLRLDGPGLQDLSDALQVWDGVLTTISEQAARHITLVTQHRCHLIRHGKAKPRDIVIAM